MKQYTLLTLVLALATTARAKPPASAPDPKQALLAGAEATLMDDLNKAIERRKAADAALAAATEPKTVADAEVSRLEGELKTATERRDALQKIIVEQLAGQTDAVKTAFSALGPAQSEFDAAVASGNALVIKEAKKKLEAATTAWNTAGGAFRSFIEKVNTDLGTTLDPAVHYLLAKDAFDAALGTLGQAVTDLGPKVADAKRKAGEATAAHAAALAEQRAAQDALRQLAVAALTLDRLEKAGERPVEVKLPPELAAQLTKLVTAVEGNTAAIGTLTTEVTGIKTAVGELTTEVKNLRADLNAKFDALSQKLDELKRPDLSALIAEIKGLKLSDEQVAQVTQNLERMAKAFEAVSQKPDNSEAIATALERIEALLRAWQENPGATVYEEEAGTNRCGQRCVRYYVLGKNNKKLYVYNY